MYSKMAKQNECDHHLSLADLKEKGQKKAREPNIMAKNAKLVFNVCEML